MRNRILAIATAALLILAVFTACSDGTSPEQTNGQEAAPAQDTPAPAEGSGDPAPSGEQVTVKVRSGWNEAGLPNWPAAIEAFEQENPNIKIEMEYTPSGEDSMTKLRAEFVAGNPPDVVQAWKTFFNEFVDAGLVENLNAEYEEYGWKEGLLMNGARSWCAPVADAANESADVYGVADYVNTSVIFYNTNIFDELQLEEPTDLEELIGVGQTISAAGYKPMVVVGAGNNFVDLLAKIQVQFTGLQYLLDVNNGSAKLTDDAMLQSMQVVERLINEGVIDKTSLTYIEDDCYAALANGTAAMLSMHTSGDANLRVLQETNPDFKFGIIKSLKFTDNPVTEYSCTYGGCWMVPASSAVKDEAKQFLFYIFGEEVSKSSASEGGRITNMLTANDNLKSETIKTVVDYHLPNLSNDSFYLVDMVPGSVLTALFSGMQAMLEGNGDAMSTLEEAQRAMDQVLADAA